MLDKQTGFEIKRKENLAHCRVGIDLFLPLAGIGLAKLTGRCRGLHEDFNCHCCPE